MPYQTDYPDVRKKRIKYIGAIRLPIMTLLSLCLFRILVKCCWIDGITYLQKKIFIRDDAVSVAWLNDLINEFRYSSGVLEEFAESLRYLIS